MASGMYASTPTPPPVQAAARAVSGAAAGSYDQYVEQQLRKTRTQVKLVDIVSNSLVLICGALAYMLVVALVDHWIVTLSFATRMLALAVLVGGCAWWLFARIMPLVVRRINPVYAAYTIERAEPSLKNSLINFLLLRGERAKVHEVVYQALGQRAASDLSHVPAENVVDYSALIRIGYVLAALVVFGAAYKILSPKDPVQSVARVMAPCADIARATRVSIDDVRPGETQVFQGDHLAVSAVLRGIRASDNVRVVFSTVDGQVVDQQVAMQPDAAGLRHVAKIPADEMGAQNSLHYKLVAGDAETRWYNVDVAPAPHVLITKVIYDPPAYTRLPSEEAAHGDLSGLEGTKVTLVARANREIASAYLEFDPVIDASSATGESDARSLRITEINGQDLQVSFQLRLADDRTNPWHKHYTIRYTSKDGHRNTRPIVHAISVKPDLAPLAEILSPNEREITVPQNRMVEIEAKAIDLDFALSKLRLVAVSGGRDVLDVALLESPEGQAGQVIKKLEFTPSHYALAVGDVVEYWAVAEDNRTSPRSGKPEPNTTSSTPTYRLIIGPPELERVKSEDEEQSEEGDRGDGDGSESSSGGAPEGNSNSAGGSNSEQNDASREPTARDESSEPGESGNSRSANGQRSSESSETEGEGEGSESSEGGTAGNSGSSSSKPSESQSGEAGESGAESSSEGSESNNSQSGNSQSNSRSTNGQRGSQGESEGSRESSEPLASDGTQDGDAFEKIQQHRQQQESNGASGSQLGDSSSDGSSNAQSQQHGESDAQSSEQNSGQQNSGNNSAGNSGNQQGQKSNGDQNGDQSGGAQSGEQNQPNKQPGNQQSGDSQSGAQPGENSQQPNSRSANGQRNAEGSESNQTNNGQKNGGEQGRQEGNQSGGQEQGNKPEQGSQGGSQQNQGGQNDQGQNQNAAGGQEGGQPQGGAKPEGDKPSNSGGGQQPKESSGGQGQNDKSGAGKESQDGGGSPQSQAEKPQQKNGGQQSGGQQSGGQKKEEGGKSPSGSNKNSNSQGESGGDRSGGGEQGGGQGAKKPGNDSAGSSSAGEQGDGAANEPGSGESGNRGGGDQVSDSPTGRSGEQTGEGSSSGPAEQGGERPQPKSGNQQGGDSTSSGNQPGGNRPKEGEQGEGQGEQISDTPGDGRGTLPTGGGKPADNHPSDTPLPDIEPGADAANLDYARKSTDLTLEYLKNQKENPDRELLDKLGWTKDDLAKFIERWDRMQRDAKRDDTGDAKRKLDDSLRSLGLRPRTSEVRTDDAGGTRLSNQRETGTRTRPPKSYADQYRAFSKFITPAKE